MLCLIGQSARRSAKRNTRSKAALIHGQYGQSMRIRNSRTTTNNNNNHNKNSSRIIEAEVMMKNKNKNKLCPIVTMKFELKEAEPKNVN